MSERSNSETTDVATAQAVEWFVRLQDAAATEADWLAFERWLAAPENAAAYAEVETLWVDIEAVAPVAGPSTARAARRSRARGRESPRLGRRAWLAGAGALAASVAAGVFLSGDLRPAPAQVWRTAPGETRVLALADGTHIRLNAASSLSVALRRHAREVTMGDGEAAFDVSHDPQRPFLIAVGDRQVRVVGTEFNIRRRDGATALTVRRGLVEVRPAGAPQTAPTRVRVGQQLVHRDGSDASQLREVEPGVAFAWTEGQLIYQDAPITEVAAELSRRFGVPVRVADARTARVRFTGVLVTDDVAAVMRRIAAFAPVTAAPSGGGYVLRSRP